MIIDSESLVSSSNGKSRVFFVVSWIIYAGGSLKSGTAFLFLPLQSISPSDLWLSESVSDSDELQL